MSELAPALEAMLTNTSRHEKTERVLKLVGTPMSLRRRAVELIISNPHAELADLAEVIREEIDRAFA